MKQDIRLYLAGQRADLAADPKLLFNYKITDTENPAAVKNNFTKSIVLEGTDNNNAIFGEIYDLSRLQTYGAGNFAGTDFNPLKKAEFELYVDSECYEKGYFKLTEITKTNKKINYSITCYGGLGEFIYNLEESAGGNKLEFKDLKIIRDLRNLDEVTDLGFTISKETVKEAWDNIYNYPSKWSVVNFAPCYNGVPDNFDADKVLINLKDKPNHINNVTGITSAGGWALGTCSRELTEWEARDLRASLQRPTLRVKALINSACYPENNGGYEVNLDEHFFNSDNPYWEDAWVTLEQIKDIMGTDESEESEEITGATVATAGTLSFYDIETDADFSSFSNLNLELEVNMTSVTPSSEQVLYTTHKADITNTFTLSDRFIKKYEYYSAVLLQLVAYDELDKVVASSAAYQLISPINGSAPADFTDKMSTDKVSIPEWKTLFGYFKKSGDIWTWCDMQGNPQKISFSFPSSSSFHKLKLRIQRPSYEEYHRTTIFGGYTRMGNSDGSSLLWPSTFRKVNGNYELSYFMAYSVACRTQPYIYYFKALASRYGGFLTGKEISRDRLLTLGVTPGQFLLSYIKLFGLHIWKDPIKKTIYIADRGVFFDNTDIRDINDYIDREKEMKITPQVAKSKWYDFNTEQHESEANSQYKEQYGMDFGLQRVNTAFDFDAANTEVYDGIFKGGVQVLESGPYYYEDYDNWPVYCYNGFTVTTFVSTQDGLDGTEHTVNTQTGANQSPLNAVYPGFDTMDKVQFHGQGNEAVAGNLTLLFLNGFESAGSNLWLTDDVNEMVSLNSKTPCWIITASETDRAGNSIAIQLGSIPHFSRYIIYAGNGHITHTWDFGRTLETYIPDTIITQGSSIYERCWKNYIADMYDVNSRVLTCRCLLKGQVNPDFLRRFYYFDGSLWRCNVIKEWNPGSYDTTICEFLKVNDLANYNVERISVDPSVGFYLPDYRETSIEETDTTVSRYYTIGGNVSAVNVNVEVQDGGQWYYGDGPGAEYQVTYEDGTVEYHRYSSLTQSGTDSGEGSKSDIFNIGTNISQQARTFRFNIVIYGAAGDHFYNIYLRQEGRAVGSIVVSRFAGSGNIPAAGLTVLLSVSSTADWTATCDYDYTTLDRYSGPSGLTTVQMAVAANDSTTASRECIARFTNGADSYTFIVTQNPSGGTSTELELDADKYVFENYLGETINGYVYCPSALGSWSVASCPAWITVSPSTGGTGTTQITLTAAANNTGAERFGEVRIAAGAQWDSLNFGQVKQPDPGFSLSLPGTEFDAAGGTYTCSVDASMDGWHFEYSNWMHPSVTYGNQGRTYFELTISPNTTGYGRVGFFRVTGGGYTEEMSITQDA